MFDDLDYGNPQLQQLPRGLMQLPIKFVRKLVNEWGNLGADVSGKLSTRVGIVMDLEILTDKEMFNKRIEQVEEQLESGVTIRASKNGVSMAVVANGAKFDMSENDDAVHKLNEQVTNSVCNKFQDSEEMQPYKLLCETVKHESRGRLRLYRDKIKRIMNMIDVYNKLLTNSDTSADFGK